VIGQRARQGDTLLHAAGQFLRIEMLKTLEADHLDQRPALRLGLGRLHALLARPVHDVAEHALPGKQRELLKYRSAIGPGPGDRFALHPGNTAARADKAADDIKQGRFSAAGGAPEWIRRHHPRLSVRSPTMQDGLDGRKCGKTCETRSISIMAAAGCRAGGAFASMSGRDGTSFIFAFLPGMDPSGTDG